MNNSDPFGSRLLAIDDEPGILQTITRVAQSVGFETITTDDPVVFARTARQWRPSVIMVDLNMPGTDGIQLLRTLAADKCAAHVVVSSGADGRILETARQLGLERGLKMSRVLPKPVRLEALRELLREFAPMPKRLLSADLAAAIADDQLFLEYQPKLDCSQGRITAVEALVRWRHPTFGVIRPDQFVALAEETDLINSLTDWVVRRAATQTAAWQAANLHLLVAANISAKDIEDLQLPERLEAHCQNAGIEPSSMILELTETSAMREAVQGMDVLTRLRLKGFHLAIDDFGTGYSSFVQLQRLPFSELKIDCAFVLKMMSEEDCKAIVEISIGLARRLKLTSVAEGAEDAATVNKLIEIGCDMVQGYHISRPIAADKVEEFVRSYEQTQSAAQTGRETA